MSLFDALLLDPSPFDVFVAKRTDARGSGTRNDPYGVNTAAQFDQLLNSLPDVPMQVHLGPGTFWTRGYSDITGGTGGFQIRPGMKIIGSGIDVTTIKLDALSLSGSAQVFAIGHALEAAGKANLMDGCSVSDLNIDCALDGRPGSPAIACGAIRIMGNHVKLHRVKAIGWGTNNSARPCFVFAIITGYAVGGEVTEVSNSGIEQCIAVTPGATAHDGIVTVFHAGGREDAGSFVEAYGKGSFIRDCFVDCGTLPSTYEVRGLSMGWCQGGVVERNQVYNTNIGGPYQDKASTQSITVRSNYYKNVLRAGFWSLGGLNPTTAINLFSLERDSDGSVALAKTNSDSMVKHGLQPGERLKIDATGANTDDFKGIFTIKDLPANNKFRYQMQHDPGVNASSGTMKKVFAIGTLIVENNLVELSPTTSHPAFEVYDGTPATQKPDYIHGAVVFRENKVRFVDGLLETGYAGYGIEVSGAKTLTIRDNTIESLEEDPIRNHRCGAVYYFNNQRPDGTLIQGVNADLNYRRYDELATDAEDAFVLAYMNRR